MSTISLRTEADIACDNKLGRCDVALTLCNDAYGAKDAEAKVCGEALGIAVKEAGTYKVQLNDSNESLSSIWRNPFAMIAIGVIGGIIIRGQIK